MTIYVDEAGIQAEVFNPDSGRTHNSRWCHLFSDRIDTAELHEFASRIGLKRSWFQPGKQLGRPSEPNPVHDHYDVTISKRKVAISVGAVSVNMEEAVSIWQDKRNRWLTILAVESDEQARLDTD